MVFGDRSTFIKCLFILPESTHPRSLRISYARYWFWWLHKGYNFEHRWKFIKMLCEHEDFINIKQKR